MMANGQHEDLIKFVSEAWTRVRGEPVKIQVWRFSLIWEFSWLINPFSAALADRREQPWRGAHLLQGQRTWTAAAAVPEQLQRVSGRQQQHQKQFKFLLFLVGIIERAVPTAAAAAATIIESCGASSKSSPGLLISRATGCVSLSLSPPSSIPLHIIIPITVS